jgi:hypothetical protein
MNSIKLSFPFEEYCFRIWRIARGNSEVFRYKIATQFMAKPLSPEEEEEEFEIWLILRRYSTYLFNWEYVVHLRDEQ